MNRQRSRKMIWCAGAVIPLLTLSAVYGGGNDPITKEVKLPSGGYQGYQYNIKSETYNWEVVGATITYSTGEGDSESSTVSIAGKFGSESEASASWSNSTGINSSRILSTTLDYDWVLSDSDTDQYSQTSSEAYQAYNATAPWVFKSWIIGPPPTDTEKDKDVDTTTVGSYRLVTTTTSYTWSLRWIEEK